MDTICTLWADWDKCHKLATMMAMMIMTTTTTTTKIKPGALHDIIIFIRMERQSSYTDCLLTIRIVKTNQLTACSNAACNTYQSENDRTANELIAPLWHVKNVWNSLVFCERLYSFSSSVFLFFFGWSFICRSIRTVNSDSQHFLSCWYSFKFQWNHLSNSYIWRYRKIERDKNAEYVQSHAIARQRKEERGFLENISCGDSLIDLKLQTIRFTNQRMPSKSVDCTKSFRNEMKKKLKEINSSKSMNERKNKAIFNFIASETHILV